MLLKFALINENPGKTVNSAELYEEDGTKILKFYVLGSCVKTQDVSDKTDDEARIISESWFSSLGTLNG